MYKISFKHNNNAEIGRNLFLLWEKKCKRVTREGKWDTSLLPVLSKNNLNLNLDFPKGFEENMSKYPTLILSFE